MGGPLVGTTTGALSPLGLSPSAGGASPGSGSVGSTGNAGSAGGGTPCGAGRQRTSKSATGH